jgi:hypothetical protein
MKDLKSVIWRGIIFVLVVGTLWHFLYEWTGDNALVGLFAPVNESTWEHMKLLFFPMLIYALFVLPGLKKMYPCSVSAMLLGILAGTWIIPVLFYTYSGILGRDSLVLDLATFLVSVLFAFWVAYRGTISCRLKPFEVLLWGLVILSILCFVIFTGKPPALGLFKEPVG